MPKFEGIFKGDDKISNMTSLVYFTSEAWIEDRELRRQVIRIPEVMGRVRKLESSQSGKDYLSVFIMDEEFQKLSWSEKIHLSNLVQQAIFERIQSKLQIQIDEVIRRSQFRDMFEAVDKFSGVEKKLQDSEVKEVLVVGPGSDEVMFLLRGHKKFKFVEILDQDPNLGWFWSEFQELSDLQ